jgi:hypothetical protein
MLMIQCLCNVWTQASGIRGDHPATHSDATNSEHEGTRFKREDEFKAVRQDTHIQSFGGETWGKERAWKT